MSVDTCRDPWEPVRYKKPYRCPQCGISNEVTKPIYRAIVLRRLGDSVALQCDVCREKFIVKESHA